MTKTAWKTVLPYGGLPLLEAVLWLLRRGGEPVELLLDGILLALGYLAALGDLREKRIPNRLVGAMLCAWILVLVPQLFCRTEYALWLLMNGSAGFLLAGVLFLAVYLVSRKGLGGGDVKFMAASGLYLGVDVLPAMFYGSVLSAAAGLGLLLAKKIGRRDAIPLAPFLFAGILIVLFAQS
ncbi:MAG: prepilin peptidase [Oscillibacter sp.]|jgi:Flp pilus assembly protein protease CpaA|nr:A24 family peptidase [uncultured Oscillibacter sp.]MCI8970260.1 prepilin peptidase [Oscillibacter sp.]